METLAPPYRCVMSIRLAMEQGVSLRVALKSFLEADESRFSEELSLWFLRGGIAQNVSTYEELRKNAFRATLVRVFASGLAGQPILESLRLLEKELHEASLAELEENLRQLPTQLMLPLLFFHFPAFLLLLVGPLLHQLSNALGGAG